MPVISFIAERGGTNTLSFLHEIQLVTTAPWLGVLYFPCVLTNINSQIGCGFYWVFVTLALSSYSSTVVSNKKYNATYCGIIFSKQPPTDATKLVISLL